MFKHEVYNFFLPKIIAKTSNKSIPRSGEKGKKVNCYTIAIDRDESPLYLVTGYKDKKLKVLEWDGKSYENEHTIRLSEIDKYEFRITHYYGLTDIYFRNIFSFTWNYITKFIYIKIRLINFISSINQYFFNKKKLITIKRMELLELMLNDQLNSDKDGIDIYDLMTKLYSIRWMNHPSKEDQKRKLNMYLDSLVESGDLLKEKRVYTVLGKAISTMERYEEEERRHVAAVKLQRKMVLLTSILVILAMLTSGLIKLPPLLDLSGGQSIEQEP